MQVGCVVSAGASRLWYVWHSLFDSILNECVPLSLTLDFIFSPATDRSSMTLNCTKKKKKPATSDICWPHTNAPLLPPPFFSLLNASLKLHLPPPSPSLPPPPSPCSPGDWVNSTE